MECLKIEKLSLKNLDLFLPVFRRVLKTGFPEYTPEMIKFFVEKDFSREVFAKKIKSKEWWGWLAKMGEETVGFLIADCLYGGTSYCSWVGLLEDFRRKGIGSRLLEIWEKEVKDAGGHKLILLTQSEKNRKFYLKSKFKDEGFEEKSWFGLDSWKFGKIIGHPRPEVFLKC